MKKSIYYVILFLYIVIVPFSILSAVKGDVNNDGVIGSGDYILIRKHILGTGKLTESQEKAADYNGDNKINSQDYILIKKKILSGETTVTPTPSPTPSATPIANTDLPDRIHFIKQSTYDKNTWGDAILLESNGHFAMVDTGLNYTADRKFVLNYLKKAGVKELDFVILTHFHRDHIGGLPYIMNNIPVKMVYHKTFKKNYGTTSQNLMTNIEKLIKEKNIERVIVDEKYNNGDSITFQNMEIHFYNVKHNENKTTHHDYEGLLVEDRINGNSDSLLQLINIGKYKVLLTGDLYDEKDNIKYIKNLSKKAEFKNLDLIKMPHHGLRRSAFGGANDGTYNTTAFKNLNPKYIISTCNVCQICEALGATKNIYHFNDKKAIVAKFANKISISYAK